MLPRLAATVSVSETWDTDCSAYSAPLVYWMVYRLEHRKVSNRASMTTTPTTRRENCL